MGFCPKCGYEYKPGFTMCSDCGVELVDELPVENNETSEITADFFMTEASEAVTEAASDIASDSDGIAEKRPRSVRSSTYVDPMERAENYRSGAVVLFLVGIIGVVALILMDLNIIPINFFGSSNYVVNIVMGALFAIFIAMGVNSMINYNKLKNKASTDDELRQRIYSWIDNELDKSILDENVSEEDNEEIKYFNRTQVLSDELSRRFDDLSDDFRDYIIEDLYDRIYG